METHVESSMKQDRKSLRDFGIRTRPAGKFAGVVLLTLCLMLPLGLIEHQIASREKYQDQVTEEISNTSASSQTITGPVLAIHYRVKEARKGYLDPEPGRTSEDSTYIPARKLPIQGSIDVERRYREDVVYIPARKLSIQGNVGVERRYRGIYQARLFHLDAEIEGAFEAPANIINIPEGSELLDANASILFGLSDLRGLDADPDVQVDKKALHFSAPDNKHFDRIMDGKRLEADLGAWTPGIARTIAFNFPLKLSGTESLSISPTAKNNIIALTSDWKHPSFGGRFLPRARTINNAGFSAQWEISQLARNLEDALKGNKEVLKIAFIDPVNIYLQAERAVKYGSLFIVLTFAAFFIGEVLRRRPMHLMQYALVGLSLAIFFLLLIALSEHLPFAQAYLAGAIACIGLIVAYLAGVFRSRLMASSFGIGLAALYGMLFTILQLEDMALLMGSLLLFAALASAMLSTRRFDWYQLKQD